MKIPANWVIVFVIALVIGAGVGLTLSLRGGDAPKVATPSDRAGFMSNGLASCVPAAKVARSNRGLTISDAKIDEYCACYMNKLSDSLNDEQLYNFAQEALRNNSVASPEMMRRIDVFAKDCYAKVL